MSRGDQRCPCACHWNWSWLNDAFKGTQISVSDIDGVVERYGNLLFFEAKKVDEKLSLGQRILLEAVTYKDRTIAVVVYGNRDVPEFYDLCKDGIWVEQKKATTKKDFFGRVARWFERANSF